MAETGPIVVVGGGHAGEQLCAGLAEAGVGSLVHLVYEEAHLPYQRPPLSKAFLKEPRELGGGFIGLEVAATARALGKRVTVLEAAQRLCQGPFRPSLPTMCFGRIVPAASTCA